MSHKKNDDKEYNDSTTDFFLRVIEKEKDQESNNSTKEKPTRKTKTIEKMGRFYNYINSTLDKILSKKSSVLILSFFITGGLFFSVSGGDIFTAPHSGTTLSDVPVVVEGLDDSMEIMDVPKTVKVGLIGPSLDIYTTKITKNYEVYLNVEELTEGEYTLNLQSRNFADTLTVMIVPDTVKVKIAPKVSQTFDLGSRFINEEQLDSEYSVSVESMAVSSVNVRASQETLDKIDRVDACIDVSKKKEAFTQDAAIKAFDREGNVLEVEIAPTTVRVECDVASYHKTVNIAVNLVGDMPAGYQVSKYTLSQTTVTIYGLEERIKDINEVQVDVDINELKSSTTLSNVSLKKESGINKFSTPSVDVTLEVEKVITKKIDNIPIKVLNNTENYKVSFVGQGNYASVVITGSESKVSAITKDNIAATIDINHLSTGSKKVNVSVAIDDEDVSIELLSSKKIAINLERK